MEHRRRGIFVAEGEKVVRRLLETPLTVYSILLTPEWLTQLSADTIRERRPTLEIFVASKELLQDIVGFRLHQGIMALAAVPADATLDALPNPHLVVALDGLAHAENVGVIVRNSVAFGADALLVGETSSSPYLRRAVRNSMGTVFSFSIIHVEHLASALEWLRSRFGTHIIAADAHGKTSLRDARLTGNICIVLGNEESGVSPGIRAVCDETVSIPMCGMVDSLNVASAAGVFLYEASRYPRST